MPCPQDSRDRNPWGFCSDSTTLGLPVEALERRDKDKDPVDHNLAEKAHGAPMN